MSTAHVTEPLVHYCEICGQNCEPFSACVCQHTHDTILRQPLVHYCEVCGQNCEPFSACVCQHNHDTILRQPVKQPSVAEDGSGLPVAEEVLAVTEIPGGTGGDRDTRRYWW